jgi:hypothetical protein
MQPIVLSKVRSLCLINFSRVSGQVSASAPRDARILANSARRVSSGCVAEKPIRFHCDAFARSETVVVNRTAVTI